MNTALAIWALVGPLIAAALGLAIGRRSEVQRQVDAVLRRETRFRHPVARPVDEHVGGVSLGKLSAAEREEHDR